MAVSDRFPDVLLNRTPFYYPLPSVHDIADQPLAIIPE